MKKKTGLNGYVYDFSVDYDAIAVDDGIEKYNIKSLDLLKKGFLQRLPFWFKCIECKFFRMSFNE